MLIAELKARQDATDDAIEKLDYRVTKHDQIIADLREACAKVATKDDIASLRKDIGEKFDRQLTDAQNSVPAKIAAIVSVGMFLIALVGLAINLRHG